VFGSNRGVPSKVSDGSGDLENTVVCSRGEPKALDGGFEQSESACVRFAITAYIPRGHLCVAVRRRLRNALRVPLACCHDAISNEMARLGRAISIQVIERYRRYLHVQIDTVQKRA